MSKYKHFAESLDTAFKTARERYMDSYNDVKAAEKRVADANAEAKYGKLSKEEAEILRDEAAIALRKAEIVFNNAQENV